MAWHGMKYSDIGCEEIPLFPHKARHILLRGSSLLAGRWVGGKGALGVYARISSCLVGWVRQAGLTEKGILDSTQSTYSQSELGSFPVVFVGSFEFALRLLRISNLLFPQCILVKFLRRTGGAHFRTNLGTSVPE